MGLAIDTVAFNTVNPGATFSAAAAATGDSLVVRNFGPQAAAYLTDIWVDQGTAGAVRVRSPRLHDNVNGLRFNVRANLAEGLFPDWVEQSLQAQDTLVVEQTGGSSETEVGCLSIYYTDLPGVQARLHNWSEIQPLIKNYVGVYVNPTSSGTIGAWGPGRALNADVDNLKANVDYALLGIDVDTAVTAVAIRGADSGNLRIAVPGAVLRMETRDWFVRQSSRHSRPYIPVFNMANKGSILVDVMDDAASTAVNINFVFAELATNVAG